MDTNTLDITVYSRSTGEIAQISSCDYDLIHHYYDSATQNFILGHYSSNDGYVDVKKSVFVEYPPKPSEFYVFDYKTKEWVYLQDFQKETYFNQVNNLAGNKITGKYPIYAQLNIGRTPEAQVMYDYIDAVRALANEYRDKIVAAKSESGIDKLMAEYIVKLDAIQ